MIGNVYAIRDRQSGFGQPFCDVNDKIAIRNFKYAVCSRKDDNMMAFVPQDYDLYKLGTYDYEKGLFISTDSGIPEFVFSAVSCLEKE